MTFSYEAKWNAMRKCFTMKSFQLGVMSLPDFSFIPLFFECCKCATFTANEKHEKYVTVQSLFFQKLIFCELTQLLTFRSSHSEVFYKKLFLKILQNSQERTCARVSLLRKLQTLAQVFSCDIYEIFKNTFLQNTSE